MLYYVSLSLLEARPWPEGSYELWFVLPTVFLELVL